MKQKILSEQELNQMIAPLLEKYHADQAVLFGSYAKGTASPDSDIDLMVIGGDCFKPTHIFSIAEELFEKTKKRVDVYEIREIDPTSSFYHSIMKEGRAVL